MGTAKPTMGFPTRGQAAASLKAKGLRNGEIARQLGVSENAVSGLLSGAAAFRATGGLPSNEAGVVEHRTTSGGEVREVILRLPENAYARLINAAIKQRQTPGALALHLYQRGWSAQAEHAAAPAEPTTNDADLVAEAARWKAMAESLGTQLKVAIAAKEARAARVAELEKAMAGAAVAANHAGALLRERDDRIAALEEDLRQRAAKKSAVALRLEAAVIDRVEPAVRMDLPAPPALTPAQLRMALGLRAAGNSNAAIARQLGVPVHLLPARKEKR